MFVFCQKLHLKRLTFEIFMGTERDTFLLGRGGMFLLNILVSVLFVHLIEVMIFLVASFPPVPGHVFPQLFQVL